MMNREKSVGIQLKLSHRIYSPEIVDAAIVGASGRIEARLVARTANESVVYLRSFQEACGEEMRRIFHRELIAAAANTYAFDESYGVRSIFTRSADFVTVEGQAALAQFLEVYPAQTREEGSPGVSLALSETPGTPEADPGERKSVKSQQQPLSQRLSSQGRKRFVEAHEFPDPMLKPEIHFEALVQRARDPEDKECVLVQINSRRHPIPTILAVTGEIEPFCRSILDARGNPFVVRLYSDRLSEDPLIIGREFVKRLIEQSYYSLSREEDR